MKKLLFSIPLGILITTMSCSDTTKKTVTESAEVVVEEAVAELVAEEQETVTINENVNADKFEELITNQNGQLLDVRTPEEWETGIINGATKMNFFDADFADQLKGLDKEAPVYVYCKSGGRSGQAATKMQELGFKTVYNLEGGITAWNTAEKVMVK